MKDKKAIPFIILAVMLAFAVGIGGWYLEREFNFRYGYGEKVQATIKGMVKPECLKAP